MIFCHYHLNPCKQQCRKKQHILVLLPGLYHLEAFANALCLLWLSGKWAICVSGVLFSSAIIMVDKAVIYLKDHPCL